MFSLVVIKCSKEIGLVQMFLYQQHLPGNEIKCTLFLLKVEVGVLTTYCRGLFDFFCTIPFSSYFAIATDTPADN